MKANIDVRGLKDYARSIELMLGREQSLVPILDNTEEPENQAYEPNSRTIQNDMKPAERQPLKRWKLSLSGKQVLGERLKFPAPQGYPLGDSYFYYFHTRREGPMKVILWAPGFGVSDLAFLFIKEFFRIELSSGWDVLVWIPPYHLDRQMPGKKAGEGLITPDLMSFRNNMNNAVHELALGLSWLKKEGYERIGAWGGSFGAASLLLLSQQEDFDHIVLMIPLIDWNTIWDSLPFSGIRQQFESKGVDPQTVASVFASVSPRYAKYPQIPSDRILFLLADYDQLTPLDVSESYIASLGFGDNQEPVVRRFKESHSTILLNRGVYKEYQKFLEQIDKPISEIPKAVSISQGDH
ncbi:S9 family peptidase [Gracilinema caldarium]|uniref:alpha/beta hydrolase family protein n=1 Tax=Gracilinema caldarium TaxID=215591 RepID=UPI0026E9696B|nr:prolyl oligopeptidase family serine peptidase [Gracilinema caldarium]